MACRTRNCSLSSRNVHLTQIRNLSTYAPGFALFQVLFATFHMESLSRTFWTTTSVVPYMRPRHAQHSFQNLGCNSPLLVRTTLLMMIPSPSILLTIPRITTTYLWSHRNSTRPYS